MQADTFGTVTVRAADARGRADFGWLDSRHTFSFGEYHDAAHMGFRTLRVINEDRVSGGGGFPTHPHRDMEIVSYVLAGAMEHQDSMGNGSTIRPGDVQRMSAGTGVAHSEFNHSPTESVHFFQIWILPERRGLPPGYEQKHFTAADRRNRLRLIGSRDGRDGSVTIHQDVELYAALLDAGQSVRHAITAGRGVWVQVARGGLAVNGVAVKAGDGVAVDGAPALDIRCTDPAEFLVFDLA
ncbi:MAG: pirin family protein [Lentisphaerae bacterium]|nr:pirin family protein [Lentisphaerota bacterium]